MFELSVLKVWERQLWTILALFREGVLREDLCIQIGLGEKKHTLASQVNGSDINAPSCSNQGGLWAKKQHRKQLSHRTASFPHVEHWNDESLSLAPNSTWVPLPKA